MSTLGNNENTFTDGNGSVADKLCNAAGTIRDEVNQAAGDVKEVAYGQFRSLKEGSAEQIGRLESYVRANPLTSLAITLGVGYLAGSFWRRN
jgi:ElaB/YqjD/DUF883 family membrane-anchored ribosome-binding protein